MGQRTVHIEYKHSGSQNVAYSGSAGASVQSSAFGAQTYWIRAVAVGAVTATNTGVHIAVGDNPTATSSSPLLPLNWIEYIECVPGQKVAALSDTATTGTLNVTELTN